MADSSANWPVTCNRFVAFLDIMGFKDLVFRNEHESVLEILGKLEPAVRMWETIARKELQLIQTKVSEGKEVTPSFPRPVFFSDSILLVSRDDSFLSASTLFIASSIVFQSAMDIGLPIKGAIAYGKQTADFEKSLHFGKPLIDAFELQNELCLYGVLLHHTAERALAEKGELLLFRDQLYKYPAPLKSGQIHHYILDWIKEPSRAEALEETFSQLYGKVSGSPRLYVDNTKKFVDWLVEQKKKSVQSSPITWPPRT